MAPYLGRIMQIKLFEGVTTPKALKAFQDKAEKYDGLYVDMNNKDERKFVKEQSKEITDIIKKLDRARIDKTNAFKRSVDEEFKAIKSSLETSNLPFSLLLDEHKAQRKSELAAQKKIKDQEQAELVELRKTKKMTSMKEHFISIGFEELTAKTIVLEIVSGNVPFVSFKNV